jgi:hypothetical protein
MDEDRAITLRLGPELLRIVDEETKRIAEEKPGLRPTRSEAVRVLLFEAVEARKKKSSSAGKSSSR